MILDARQICHGQLLRADLCIVGAGAAGIALALQFVDSEFAVLLLESGGEQPDAAIASLNEGHVADPALHPPPARFRRRGLGGSTRIWGGRCVPLDDIDFERRAWIGHSGWPIGPDALSGFYPAANRLCEAGAFAYRARDAFPQGMAPLIEGFRSTRFTDSGLERFSCPTDFGRRYRARLEGARRLRLVLHATVTRLRCAEDGGRVEMLTAQTITGRAFSVRATHFVLAMGGLEIPRLLLASRAVHANGIGNLGDAVGRFYMCHIAGSAGRLRPSAGTRGIHHGYQIAADGTYCRRRLALTPAAQRELGTGNIILRLHHPRIADPGHGSGALSALCLARPFILPEYRTRLRDPSPDGWRSWAWHVRNLLTDVPATTAFFADWLQLRLLASRKLPSVVVTPKSGCYSLDFHAEQVPRRDSRITLADECDRLGVPRLKVEWRLSATDLHTVRAAFAALRLDLHHSGCATLDYTAGEAEAAVLRDGAYGGHHIGTARMSASPRHGVVDAHCRVHGIGNLFVAGSAVFPTSGQANPTLTIVALALRLAEHLRRDLRAGPPVVGAGVTAGRAMALPPTSVE